MNRSPSKAHQFPSKPTSQFCPSDLHLTCVKLALPNQQHRAIDEAFHLLTAWAIRTAKNGTADAAGELSFSSTSSAPGVRDDHEGQSPDRGDTS
jgi:hypothetical protein